MVYREFQPSTLLKPYIETYWTAYGCNEQKESHRILPDGCVDIVLSLNSFVHSGLKPFVPNIIGTMTTYSVGIYDKNVILVGIRFRPVGFTAFCNVPIYEFTDRRIDLTLVESVFDEHFYAELPEKENVMEVIRHMDDYFLQKLRYLYTPEPQIVYSIEIIRSTNGIMLLQEVARQSCLSTRHFERKFKAAVGITPKMFSRVVKFQYACSYLESNNDTNLFSVALDCGYYDKSHLMKDFKYLSGKQPSSFR